MKLKFKHQRFQTEAAKCVTDAFLGQKYSDSAEAVVSRECWPYPSYGELLFNI